MEMDKCPWPEKEYREWLNKRDSQSCSGSRSQTGPQVEAAVRSMMKSKKSPAQVVEYLSCLVPNKPNEAREGGRIPLEGANCKAFAFAVTHIAEDLSDAELSAMSSVPDMFNSMLEKSGIRLRGDELIKLGELVTACKVPRPYREWGTTNYAMENGMRVTMTAAPDLPKDVHYDNSFRVEMFCLHGVAKDQSSMIIRPGDSSSLTVGFNKWEVIDGLSCQLNTGLSSVREYEIGGHTSICVKSNLYLRRNSPDLPYHLVPTRDECPYEWVVEPSSTKDHAKFLLKMKSQSDRDGDVAPVSAKCPSQQRANANTLAEQLEADIKKSNSPQTRGAAVKSLLECLVPLRKMGNLIVRRPEADCKKAMDVIDRVAYRAIKNGVRSPRGIKPSYVEDAFHIVMMMYDIDDPEVNTARHWTACNEPIPRAEMSKLAPSTPITGPIIEIISSNRGVQDFIAPDRVEIEHCLHGILIEKRGDLKLRMSLPKTDRGLHVAANFYEPTAGIACSLPLLQRGHCLLASSLVKYGDQPWLLLNDDHDRNCEAKWDLDQSDPLKIRVTLVPSNN